MRGRKMSRLLEPDNHAKPDLVGRCVKEAIDPYAIKENE
jgi:hypothetical protein